MSSPIGKARKWLAGVVAGDELPSYEKTRAEMGGVPWRRLDHTDSWFLMSAESLEAQDGIDLDAPIDSQPILDTIPAMPPILSEPEMPVIAAAAPLPTTPPLPLPLSPPVIVAHQTRDTLAAVRVQATMPPASPSLADPVWAPMPELTPELASLSGEQIYLRTPVLSKKTLLGGAAVAAFIALIAVVAVRQPPAPVILPQAVAAPAPAPVAKPAPQPAAVVASVEKKVQQAEPRIRPAMKHPARRARRH